MIWELAVSLEATTLAVVLRGSAWAYPLVNAGHIFGVALLVGSILPLDLRIIGWWASVPLAPLWRVLGRTAAVGLGFAVACGILLFITRATAYVQSGLFLAKMVVVGIGAANALILFVAAPGDVFSAQWTSIQLPWYIRLSAWFSLAAWLTALVLGRLIGYY